MSLHAFRYARFRYWYIGRFSEKFPVERKKDSFVLIFGALIYRNEMIARCLGSYLAYTKRLLNR
jgi:hypothetical protein